VNRQAQDLPVRHRQGNPSWAAPRPRDGHRADRDTRPLHRPITMARIMRNATIVPRAITRLRCRRSCQCCGCWRR
jgi:hypothetical protein